MNVINLINDKKKQKKTADTDWNRMVTENGWKKTNEIKFRVSQAMSNDYVILYNNNNNK